MFLLPAILQFLFAVHLASAAYSVPNFRAMQRDRLGDLIQLGAFVHKEFPIPAISLTPSTTVAPIEVPTETTTIKPVELVTEAIASTTTKVSETTTLSAITTAHVVPTATALNASKPNRVSYEQFVASNNRTYYVLRSVFRLVSLRVSSGSNVSMPALNKSLSYLEELIKHSILKYMSPRLDSVCVKLEKRSRKLNSVNVSAHGREEVLTAHDFPICLNLTVKSSAKVLDVDFENALIDLSVNKEDCQLVRNESSIKCFMQTPKHRMSLLRLGDYWIQFHNRSDLYNTESLKLMGATSEDITSIWAVNQTWVIGLAVIAGIIFLFFCGCVAAICYTRRPYRRSGKVYEVESGNKKQSKVQIPGVHPATKASVVTKNKELYY